MTNLDPTTSFKDLKTPSIDKQLELIGSKYALVVLAAKRAREISGYFSQLNEGLLENVGPMVPSRRDEKPLSISLKEIAQDFVTIEGK